MMFPQNYHFRKFLLGLKPQNLLAKIQLYQQLGSVEPVIYSKLLRYEKMKFLVLRRDEHGTKKKSEFPTGLTKPGVGKEVKKQKLQKQGDAKKGTDGLWTPDLMYTSTNLVIVWL